MNILIPDSWLKEYVQTKASPQDIAKNLSLCSQSVERINHVDNDAIYDTEITSNRPDCLSIYGIARELSAVLPRFDIPAKLLPIPNYQLLIPKNPLPLEVKITDPSLCPRFTALIFENVKVKESPKIVRDRLEKCGIRALNNVVDISNYLMLELGQPMHTFDYDKVKKAKMILREAKEGEEIVTLDKQKRKLPKGTIIIEDGEGKIIDLCGIMGGQNSAVDENTTRVLLFVQTYDPVRIRRTCQELNFRTQAASYFEKGVDPEEVITAIKKAADMLEKNCDGKVAGKLIDIYPDPQKPKKVSLTQEKLNQVLGIVIKLSEAKNILESLGFGVEISNNKISAKVPHWRHEDVSIPEDLIEEVARIYGYFKIPAVLPVGELPEKRDNKLITQTQKAKEALKFWGFTEAITYSFVSENLLKKSDIDPNSCLKIANPLTEEWVYMRTMLVPSLLEVAAKNQEVVEDIKIFELSRVYLPKGTTQLPEETQILTMVQETDNFLVAKGRVEALLEELGLSDYEFEIFENNLFSTSSSISIKGKMIGEIGEISALISARFGLKKKIIVIDLNFDEIIKHSGNRKAYQAIAKYPGMIEDLSFIVPQKTEVGNIIRTIKETDSIIKNVEFLNSFENNRSFRILYQDPQKTLDDKEVQEVRTKIIEAVEKEFKAKLKSQD